MGNPGRRGASPTPVANSNLISPQPPLYHIEKMILYSHEYKQELSYQIKNMLVEVGAAPGATLVAST